MKGPAFGAVEHPGAVMAFVVLSLEILRRFFQRIGPYLLVEILLPGGSVVALLLFLYQRRRRQDGITRKPAGSNASDAAG